MELIDVVLGVVGEDWRRDGLGHLLKVPYERGPVIGAGADVAGGVGGPRDGVDGRSMRHKLGYRNGGHANIQDDRKGRVREDGRQIVGVLLVPREPQQRVSL